MAVAKSNINENLLKTILEKDYNLELRDRYDLGEELGWGQFGIIRSCSDKITGELLACKSVSKDKLVTDEDIRSIKLEIKIMTQLSGHSNLVDLKGVYEDEDCVHLVMELCAGGELFHLLEKRGRFSESEARVIFSQLMKVMYCHEKGVVHRDLKPENVLLATKDSSSPIKLADFGLATYIKPGQKLHGTVGSPFYIAPEVLCGRYNQAADVWSAGVILYILLSGIPPFWGKTKSCIFDAVRAADLKFQSEPWDRTSDSAKDLIWRMLSTDPSGRLTAQQVLEHAWISCPPPLSMDLYVKHQYQGLGKLDTTCASFMARNEDISFNTGSPIICDSQSPKVTCRSSFSSFLVAPLAPSLASDLFSFCSSGGSNTLEFSTPLSTMCSFTFFGSSVATKQKCQLEFSTDVQGVDLVSQDSSSLCFEHGEIKREHNKLTDLKRLELFGGTRLMSIHSKRNRTIGVGEFEQLDVMVTEAIIRWASCANLPTTASLTSSLVF